VLNAAFDINENRGKEGGRARVDGSQYKAKERVARIGSAECTNRKVLFLATVRETCIAKLDTALHWQEAESPFQSGAQSQSNKTSFACPSLRDGVSLALRANLLMCGFWYSQSRANGTPRPNGTPKHILHLLRRNQHILPQNKLQAQAQAACDKTYSSYFSNLTYIAIISGPQLPDF